MSNQTWALTWYCPLSLLCCSPTGTAELSLLVPARSTTELLAKPSLSLRSFIFLACFFCCPVHFFSVVRLPTSPRDQFQSCCLSTFTRGAESFWLLHSSGGPSIWILQSRWRVYFSQTTDSGVSAATILRMPGTAELSPLVPNGPGSELQPRPHIL